MRRATDAASGAATGAQFSRRHVVVWWCWRCCVVLELGGGMLNCMKDISCFYLLPPRLFALRIVGLDGRTRNNKHSSRNEPKLGFDGMVSVVAVDDDKSPSRKLPGINGLPLSRQFTTILGGAQLPSFVYQNLAVIHHEVRNRKVWHTGMC